ncbi:PREDICTED: beta-1,4 N-acetylgalactosaminyltransferase 2 isoform X1 [Galeopterus variegatus]|uniref:Beta-1,4 N-acetylgalactosaminyltransferase 2 isoform X1 n=1 Tax=Galeopterus variegatus TaxID=482537 RepID=A0ABM0R7K3_GALVR|nr:PREDICTED: beta-1,4 N-acetylgalactosaminyltransferase 2 isoform X1 [Galeopterus variegatus]XP_008576595.1 PREDICTED: beta-1,4 N-acetylgalactosaminyltransferase 2 isoform X1 [Galeopterus variegatus]
MASCSSRSLWLLKMSILIIGLGIVLFMFRSVPLLAKFSSLKAEPWSPAPGVQTLKLLPEERLRNLFSYDGIWLFPKNQCKCEDSKQQGGYNFQKGYGQSDLPAVKARRQAEFEHFQRREGLPRPPPLLAQPNLPFGYPVHGVEVMPLHTIPIPGLQFDGPDAPTYKVTLTASLGTLNTLADIPDNVVQGRGQKQLTISTSDRKLLNFILQHVTYTSTVYQHHGVDMVSLESSSSVAKFPVTIHHPVIPKLYDPGPERQLRNLVTIATKTFLRPHKFKIMLQSIREFYPDLTVIVADDSNKPLKIEDDHVEYYTMPFGKGWFAGRNLAISQVTTKYVLWVDDDFLFNNKTKIEVLVDVLEKTELDVVGGSVLGNTFQFKLLLEQGESGDCLHRRWGSFRPLDGFPSCVVTSGVVNFFLAHTEQLRRVGFDPRLQRVAHSEFFIDGLGSLLVGSCPEVIIGHQSQTPVKDVELAALEKSYSTYRANTNAQIQFKLALHYFKNHLQCST